MKEKLTREEKKKRKREAKASKITIKEDRKQHKKKQKENEIQKKNKKKREQEDQKRNQGYILKRNTMIKFFRIVLWGILIFIFMKGVIISLQPNATTEARILISNFRSEFANYKDENEEILGFAQNFTKEYLTYVEKGETDYKNRLIPYVGKNILSVTGISDFSNKAKAIYVKAYRKEAYGNNQWDVYVIAEVEYENKKLDAESKNFITETFTEQSTLKVPIYVKDSTYIVEDLPMFVSDSIKNNKYTSTEYYGTAVSEVTTKAIEESLTSFLKAYYEEEQNVIEYYLSKNADRNKFRGLQGRYIFDSIEGLKCYQEAGQTDFTCIVKFKIKDINEAILMQQLNIGVNSEGGKYYIEDMSTKITNIK